jgi:hypothetical protein
VVELEWTTMTESMNNYFTVERSVDGVHFETIAQINGAGTSAYAHHYTLQDMNPQQPYSYYRLRQTDFNGTIHEMGEIKEVNRCGGNDYNMNVFPNPSIGPVSLNISNLVKKENFTVTITNILGKTISRQTFELSEGDHTLPLTTLPQKGGYLVQVSWPGNTTGNIYKIVVP